jgi:hypothetical protein
MGLFDMILSVGKSILSEAEKQQTKTNRTTDRNLTGSAIPPGRMRETDKVKGKECDIPDKPGVYRHKNKETGEVEYSGQTDNLRRRQQEHSRNGKLDTDKQNVAYSVAKADAQKDDLLKTEKDHIKRHNPSGNKTEGGNGRR